MERRVLLHDLRRGQGAELRRGGRHGLRREQRLHAQQHHGACGPGPLFERRNNVHLLGNVIIVLSLEINVAKGEWLYLFYY